MKKLIFLLAILFIIAVGNSTAQNKSVGTDKLINRPKLHKIIFQLASQDTLEWKGLMNNIKHIKEGWGETVKIAIVAHGPGIDFLIKEKTTQQKSITRFKDMGVEFIACENTMKQKNMSKGSIISEATYVKMGIGEIVERQEQGWSYIKAGF
ncbi:MAG: DsrE family protein [Saprospiraceae bacterium]|nr:DsrE family protein [Saprospiraceae bacterium]MBK6565841.1 DsrE family protein [Saprospiraceae bacterium]MBK6784579.1 DsrE family protein [Saprospiraceae bacterium]MBK8081234.1 DsrE family protein [Saprospiraceae bacterium]MBK8370148.1 DsrE family protein [Saprospiraceae bacterium]